MVEVTLLCSPKTLPIAQSVNKMNSPFSFAQLFKYFLYSVLTGERVDPMQWQKHTVNKNQEPQENEEN